MKRYADEGRQSCPFCKDAVLLNRDGLLRKHRRFVAGGVYSQPKWVACEGSGQPPEASDE